MSTKFLKQFGSDYIKKKSKQKKIMPLLLAGLITFASYGVIKSCSNSPNSKQFEQKENSVETKITKAEEHYTVYLLNNLEKLTNDQKASEKYSDRVIENGIQVKEKFNLPYKKSTIDKFMNVVQSEVRKNPVEMKDYLLENVDIGIELGYNKEIWDRFSSEEKWKFARFFLGKTVNKEFKEKYEKLKSDAKNIYEDVKEKKISDKIIKNFHALEDFFRKVIPNYDSGGQNGDH